MKIFKYTLLFFLLVGLFKPAMAQPTLKDSTAAYHYWAHRGIVEMVYAYMNDYTEALDESKSIEEHTGKKKYEVAFINEMIRTPYPTSLQFQIS